MLRVEIENRRRMIDLKTNPMKLAAEKGEGGGTDVMRQNAKTALKNSLVPDDEIESAIKKKLAIEAIKDEIKDEKKDEDRIGEYKGKFIKRRALIDQMLLDNKKADFSYAEKKYKWKTGNEDEGKGYFSGIDLAEWYRVYNQTQIDNYGHLKTKKTIF